MLKLLPTVRLKDLVPQMAVVLAVVKERIEALTGDCVITSANDSTHMTGSLHYKGAALDFRTHTIYSGSTPQNRLTVLNELRDDIKSSLGQDFDVLIEDANLPNEHCHVEYQVHGW